MNFTKSLFLSASLFLINSAQAIRVNIFNASTYEQEHCVVCFIESFAGTKTRNTFEINTEYQDSTDIYSDRHYTVTVLLKQHDNDTDPISWQNDNILLKNNGVLVIDIKERTMKFFKYSNK